MNSDLEKQIPEFETEEQKELIEELRQKIIDQAEEEKDYDDIQDRIVKFSKNLNVKYPDFTKYRLYHLLIGSTPWEECPKFDFPGDDSIESFIDRGLKL